MGQPDKFTGGDDEAGGWVAAFAGRTPATAPAHRPKHAAALVAAMLDAAEEQDRGTLAVLGSYTPDQVAALAGGDAGKPDPTPESKGGGLADGADVFRRLTESAPGPAPHPGLVWNDQTHRWRHPETGEEHEHTADGSTLYRKAFSDPKSLTPAEAKNLALYLPTMAGRSLETFAQVHKIKTGGGKAVLAARILTYLDAQQAAGSGPSAPADSHPWPDHPAAHHVRDALHASDLPPELKESYGAASAAVLGRIPRVGHDRMAKHLAGRSTFHPDNKAVGLGAIAAARAVAPPGEHAKLDALAADIGSGRRAFGGAYVTAGGGSVHLDGGLPGQTPAEVHAHEYGHAIDGPDREISKSPGWAEAFAAEIEPLDGEKPRLSTYARTSPHEGLAEFARAVYGGRYPLARVAALFPKATAVLKERGLWPAS